MIQLLRQYKTQNMAALIVDNPDWENVLTPALVEWGRTADNEIAVTSRLALCASSLRCLVEIAYAMGYAYGKSETAHG